MQATEKDPRFDSAKAEAFAGKFLTALNHGSLCVMASIGHRTGLFDAMSTLLPSTSSEIAEKAGLNERYVREWLGAMVAAGVVEVDPATLRYALPAKRGPFRHCGPDSTDTAGGLHSGSAIRPVISLQRVTWTT